MGSFIAEKYVWLRRLCVPFELSPTGVSYFCPALRMMLFVLAIFVAVTVANADLGLSWPFNDDVDYSDPNSPVPLTSSVASED